MNSYLIGLYAILVLVALLIPSIICGLISLQINNDKGYDGGFAWGFCLGILGIIVTAIRPFKKPVVYIARESERKL
jgi:hypothetical protein